MVLGQSAATAAVMAIDDKVNVQSVSVPELQAKLTNDPLADGSVFEILVDNSDSTNVERRGSWTTQTKGGYGPDFLVQEGSTSIASVKFVPEIARAGKYEGYIYFPKAEGISSRTMVVIYDGERNHGISIKESDIRVEGQTSGEWVPLGTYRLPAGKKSYTMVSNKDADGKIIADAVIWVPAE